MGFLDHLFKLKPSEAEKGGNGKEEEAAPDPGAFLHPKYFVPRGSLLPAAPNGRTAERPPPSEQRPQEIVLTLGDVLARIPTPLLHVGLHDAARELRFSIDDLSSDIARGRAAIPLSKIAALCPDVFSREIGPDDDTEIRLPLQKLVQQIGLLRSRPQEPVAPPAPAPSALPAAPEPALAKDSPPTDEPSRDLTPPVVPDPIAPAEARSPTPPPTAELASPAPGEPPAAAAPPAREPAPSVAAELPAASPPLPVDEVAAAPAPVIHFHPPPLLRPVLVHPPPILAPAAHATEPLVSREPAPRTALQTFFNTDDPLDLAAICRRTATLPGVRACALDLRGAQALAGDAPEGFDHAALHAAATRQDALPLGTLESVTLHGDQAAISIFARPGLLLAVLHGELSPAVREQITALADMLAQSPSPAFSRAAPADFANGTESKEPLTFSA